MTKALAPSERQAIRDAVVTIIAGFVVAVGSGVGASLAYSTSATAVAGAALVGPIPAILSAAAVLHRRPRMSTPADRVTLARAVLASCCAAITVLVLANDVPARTWWFLALVSATLLLDSVDGLVARRTGTSSAAGARLDLEVDAGVLVVLCLAAATVVGWWVLLIGAMRYLLMLLTWLRPHLRTPLPRNRFRVMVAALQGAALAVALAPVVPVGLAKAVLVLALGLLLVSFGTEIATKERLARSHR